MKIKGFKLNPIKIIGGGLALVAATLAVKGANDVVQEGIERCPDEVDTPENDVKEIETIEDNAEDEIEAEEVEEAAEPEVLNEDGEKIED